MSGFSQILKNYVSTQGIPIQTLSKLSGIDRSFIQHMLTGKRIPTDVEMLEKIIRAMTLTPNQAQHLRHFYYVERIGSDIYNRHILVKELLETVDLADNGCELLMNTGYQHDFSDFPMVSAFYGTTEIHRIIKVVLEAESPKENGYIKLLVQPEHSFLLELLTVISSRSSLPIEHIFCMQKDIPVASDNHINLMYVKNIIPLLLSASDYRPYIYYDEVEVKFNQTSIFPYFIITSDKVITISHDFSYATLYLGEDPLRLYSTIYHNIYRVSFPFVKQIYDPMEFYRSFVELEASALDAPISAPFKYSLICQPCLMYVATEEQLNKYANDFPMRNEVIALMANRATAYNKLLASGHSFVSYFTEEGLDLFCSTGQITEIPEAFYSPLEIQDRLTLMEELYQLILTTSYQLVAIDPDAFKVSTNLILTTINEALAFFVYIHPVKGPLHFIFHEKSIAYSFFSFMNFLRDSEFAFSKQKSLELLEKKIKQCREELDCPLPYIKENTYD